jgi:hypothetical protein
MSDTTDTTNRDRPKSPAVCAPSSRALALALEERAHTPATTAESAVELAHHAEGLPVVEVAKWLTDLTMAADLAEGVADKLWKAMSRNNAGGR